MTTKCRECQQDLPFALEDMVAELTDKGFKVRYETDGVAEEYLVVEFRHNHVMIYQDMDEDYTTGPWFNLSLWYGSGLKGSAVGINADKGAIARENGYKRESLPKALATLRKATDEAFRFLSWSLDRTGF